MEYLQWREQCDLATVENLIRQLSSVNMQKVSKHLDPPNEGCKNFLIPDDLILPLKDATKLCQETNLSTTISSDNFRGTIFKFGAGFPRDHVIIPIPINNDAEVWPRPSLTPTIGGTV
jgi:hypothetical protein